MIYATIWENTTALVYKSTDFLTFQSMVSAINTDSANGVVECETNYPATSSSDLVAAAIASFSGGDDGLGLTKEQLFKKLSGDFNVDGTVNAYGAYQMIENYQTDFVYPTGVYADDALVGKYDNFAYELALCCANLSQSHMSHGIIAMKPCLKTGLADIEAYVKYLETYPNNYYLKGADGSILQNSDGKPYDIGGYISVIAGPDLSINSSRLGRYNDTGVAVYAAKNSAIAASSAPTNKVVKSVAGIRYIFSIKQLSRLANNRFVTFQLRTTDNNVIITDGVTAAQSGSDYSRIVNIKVVKACLDAIYTIAQPYIGEPPTPAQNNSLTAAISKRFDKMMESGDLANYSFQLITNSEDKLIGDTKLELNIVPPGERRRITVIVGLKKSI